MNRQIWQNRARTLQTCSPIQTDHYDTEYVEAKECDQLRVEVERLKKQVGDSRLYAQDRDAAAKEYHAEVTRLKAQCEMLVKALSKARDFCDNNDRHQTKQSGREAAAYTTCVSALAEYCKENGK